MRSARGISPVRWKQSQAITIQIIAPSWANSVIEIDEQVVFTPAGTAHHQQTRLAAFNYNHITTLRQQWGDSIAILYFSSEGNGCDSNAH
jgi:hypothetical protein